MSLPYGSEADGGGRLVIESRQSGRRSVQVMEFSGRGHVRMTHEDDESFGLLLMPDGMPFFFGCLAGRAVAVDLVAGMGRAGTGTAPDGHAAPATRERVVGLHATGIPQNVAGIEGEAFRVEWLDEDAGHRFEEITLTGDRRLQPCVRTLAAALAHDTGIRSHDTRLDRMAERGWFALSADGYRVATARFGIAAPPRRFDLDAAPGDDLRVMFHVVIEAARSRVLNHAPPPALEGGPGRQPQ